MSVADLLAEHGSPLWLANLDVVRDRQRAFTAAWRAEWPDVEIAYSHKANRLPAILRALAEKGIGHQVACEAEYCLARSVANWCCSVDRVTPSTSTSAICAIESAIPPQPQPMSRTFWPGLSSSLAAMCSFFCRWAASSVSLGSAK